MRPEMSSAIVLGGFHRQKGCRRCSCQMAGQPRRIWNPEVSFSECRKAIAMTLPEHAACSFLIAHLGCRQRLGNPAVCAVVAAGILPDLDVAAKLISEPLFWRFHHVLGHCLIAVILISASTAGIAGLISGLPFRQLMGWCLLSSGVHILTDIPYFWGVRVFWPFLDWEPCLNAIEYLDLFVVGLWVFGVAGVLRFPANARWYAGAALSMFFLYVVLRWNLPAPTGWLRFLLGGWVYAAPNQTPVLDWW
jgi:membrane-bound metal-dependent hydrolase YbcI (DUF457 family)